MFILDIKKGLISKESDGSAAVSLGGTSVMAVVTAMIGSPSNVSPCCGDVEVCVTLSSVSSANYDRSKSDEAILLENAVSDIIKGSGIIDLSQLCIVDGEQVYVLRINILCLSNAGNLFDASVLAAAIALSDTKLPSVIIEHNVATVDPSCPPKPLTLLYIPVPVTVGVFDDHIFIDPSRVEEDIFDGVFSFGFSPDGSVLHMQHRHKGSGASTKMLKQVLDHCSIDLQCLRQRTIEALCEK